MKFFLAIVILSLVGLALADFDYRLRFNVTYSESPFKISLGMMSLQFQNSVNPQKASFYWET